MKRSWVRLAILGVLLLTHAGCTRPFFRKWADTSVDSILGEKDRFARWKIENMRVYPDPRARFADPTNPDRPPMPPDDPAAKALSPNPQKPYHSGVGLVEGCGYLDLLAQWDAENRARREALLAKDQPIRPVSFLQPTVEPEPRELAKSIEKKDLDIQTAEPKGFLLDVDHAVELGLINSREFQSRRENLYLSALPVTRERFSFAAQFFAFDRVFRERSGAQTDFGKGDRWRSSGAAGVGKFFSTGALLLLAFANQTVVELHNPSKPNVTSVSTLNLDFIQPLLQGGGRAVSLEPLTLTERLLLYDIRAYARFRKQFYQAISGGGDLPQIGGVGSQLARGVVLARAEGLGADQASPQVRPGNAGTLFLNTLAAAPSQGYLPTLQRAAFITIQTENVQRLEDILRLFRAYEEGGDISSLQVGQVELQLLQARSTALQRQLDYRDSLDNFKLQLGIPLNVPLELEDAPLQPVSEHLRLLYKSIKDFEAVAREVDLLDGAPPAQVRGGLRALLLDSALTAPTVQFRKTVPQRWDRWQKEFADPKALIDRLDMQRDARRKLLDRQAELEAQELALPRGEAEQLKQLDAEIPLGEFELALRRYEAEPWAKAPGEKARREERAARWRDVRNAFVLVLGEASNERLAQLRPRWPQVPPVVIGDVDIVNGDLEQAYAAVTRVALDNRLDLMNTRAQLVDAWRQLRVFANNLLGVFNVAYHLDAGTPFGEARPLAFIPERTRHQLVMNLELPLVRVEERNAYRASLIAYQRARRNLMEQEDLIAQQVRAEVRQLQVLAKTFKIQQQAVELAYLQVESSLETFRAPPAPGATGNSAGNAAALTQQLLNAYARLPQVQEQLLAIWTNYLVGRQQLLLDTELMPLDSRGLWNDPFNDAGRPFAGRVAGEPATPSASEAASPPALETLPAPARR